MIYYERMAGVPEKKKRNMEVVVLRNKGYTFEEVASLVSKRYNKISRIAVHRIYKRDKDKYKDISDIANSL